MNEGLVTKSLNWITHPYYQDDNATLEWAAGLGLVVVIAFLWSQVLKLVK